MSAQPSVRNVRRGEETHLVAERAPKVVGPARSDQGDDGAEGLELVHLLWADAQSNRFARSRARRLDPCGTSKDRRQEQGVERAPGEERPRIDLEAMARRAQCQREADESTRLVAFDIREMCEHRLESFVRPSELVGKPRNVDRRPLGKQPHSRRECDAAIWDRRHGGGELSTDLWFIHGSTVY